MLRRRGHRVVFAAEASWEGRLAALGFEEYLFHLSEPSPEAVDAVERVLTEPRQRRPARDDLGEDATLGPSWLHLLQDHWR